MFVASKVLSKGSNFIDANQRQELPVFAVIPCDVPFGSIKHYETEHDDLDIVNYNSETDLQTIDIRLYDGRGTLLNFEGEDVNIILKIYYRV